MGFPGGAVLKDPLGNAGDAGDSGLVPGSGRSPGGGHDNPLQCSCLGSPESPWTEEPGGLSPWGHKGSDVTEHALIPTLLSWGELEE